MKNTVKEFIEKLKRADENSELVFTYQWQELEWSYMYNDEKTFEVELDLSSKYYNPRHLKEIEKD